MNNALSEVIFLIKCSSSDLEENKFLSIYSEISGRSFREFNSTFIIIIIIMYIIITIIIIKRK